MSDKLKPCPFCGSNNIKYSDNHNICQNVQCKECGALMYTYGGDPVAKWNKRTPEVQNMTREEAKKELEKALGGKIIS